MLANKCPQEGGHEAVQSSITANHSALTKEGVQSVNQPPSSTQRNFAPERQRPLSRATSATQSTLRTPSPATLLTYAATSPPKYATKSPLPQFPRYMPLRYLARQLFSLEQPLSLFLLPLLRRHLCCGHHPRSVLGCSPFLGVYLCLMPPHIRILHRLKLLLC